MKKLIYILASLFSFILATSFSPKFKPSFSIKTVVIDAGHGGKDPGCHGAKYKEKDVALAVALKLGNFIEKNMKDVEVIYTRKTDVFIELQERANIANKAKADLFICIHCNSACFRDKKLKKDICKDFVHGAETYVMGIKNEKGKLDVAKRENSAMLLEDDYVQKYDGFDPNSDESYIIMSMFTDTYLNQSLSFASKLQDQYKTKGGRKDKGVKRASLWVLWRTFMPSVLTEIGYLTNPEEEKFLGSMKGQEYVAACIFRAFRSYKDELEGIQKKYDDAFENMENVVPIKDSTDVSEKEEELADTAENNATEENKMNDKPNEKLLDNKEEKPKEVIVEKPKEKPAEKAPEKEVKKPKEVVVEKPKEKIEEKPKEMAVEKPKENVEEKPKEIVAEKPKEVVIEKPKEIVVEKPKETVAEKPIEKTKDVVVEKPQEKIEEKPKEVVVEKPKETVVEKPIEKPKEVVLEKPKEKTEEKPKEVVVEKPKETVVEKPIEKPKEVLVEKPKEKIEEKPKETVVEKPIEKPKEVVVEKPKEVLVEKPKEKVEEKPKETIVEKPIEKLKEKASSAIVYKVQIYMSDKKLDLKSDKFKGIDKPGEYMDKGVYKYTSGEFSDKKEAVALLTELRAKGFKDAFVIMMQDGKRVLK